MSFDVEEYFKTTFNDKLLVKMPEREDEHLTAGTRLMEKKREMAEVEQALTAQKEEFQMKMESLQQRREELERKECQLKESLLKFDKFIKENDAKRARAVKKASDERELIQLKSKEIQNLQNEMETLTKQKETLQKRIERHAVHHKYMESVLEKAHDFREIREVIARYDTLIATHQDLVEREQNNQDVLELQKQELVKYTEHKNNEILSYNNQLGDLQMRLDKAHSEAVLWESRWTHIKNTAATKTLLLGQIKMAIHNLYQLITQRDKNAEDLNVNDPIYQLTMIQEYIQDLSSIIQEIKHGTDTNLSSITG